MSYEAKSLNEECGIFGIWGHPDAAQVTYFGLHSLQHRGQEGAGIVANNSGKLDGHRDLGLLAEVFQKQEQLNALEGTAAIGHVRYATAGTGSVDNIQPFLFKFYDSQIGLAHNGNLTNAKRLRKQLEREGAIFHSNSDTEILMHLIRKSTAVSFLDKLKESLNLVKGGFAYLLLTETMMIAALDPNGFRPLSIGQMNNGAYVVASETCALETVGARFIQDVAPGEVVIISDEGLKIEVFTTEVQPAICAMEYIYFARPDSNIAGVNVHTARKRMGKNLAIESPVAADMVIGVPNSSLSAASGYAEEAQIPYELGLVKNQYVARTFIQPTQELREQGVRMKLSAVRGVVKGKKVVLVDDSIVRGTTIRRIIHLLKEAEAIEMIDIGGPSMLRSAAKNYQDVTAVVDPSDYEQVLSEISSTGTSQLATRKRLAAKVFRHTAAYDALIADYLTTQVGETEPEKQTLTYERKQTLRYGENSHQQATFYQSVVPVSLSIASARQLHGKELSYNNIRDADAALRIASEFTEPTVVAVKHMNPCGIGTGKTILAAYRQAFEADPVSIFGGIVVLNRPVDQATAAEMHQIFLEIIIAPSFEEEALALLSQKKNLRLLTLDFHAQEKKAVELVSVMGGLLIQEQDTVVENDQAWQVVTERQPTPAERDALNFAWKAVKHVKSNAIVLANESQTVGIGAGQMNRIGSVKIAVDQAQAAGKLQGAVLASDAFFPMADSVEYAAQHGIQAIIQPGGSIKDQASIDLANHYGIAMIFTGTRHFKH